MCGMPICCCVLLQMACKMQILLALASLLKRPNHVATKSQRWQFDAPTRHQRLCPKVEWSATTSAKLAKCRDAITCNGKNNKTPITTPTPSRAKSAINHQPSTPQLSTSACNYQSEFSEISVVVVVAAAIAFAK